jgi:hypothetical protein
MVRTDSENRPVGIEYHLSNVKNRYVLCRTL